MVVDGGMQDTSQPMKPRRTGRSARARREAIQGYLWIAPWFVGFVLFILGPMLASLFLSFTQYSLTGAPAWTGLANYRQAFIEDRLFWSSFGRTILYAIITVPLGIAGSLLAALLLNQKLKGTTWYRACFFVPSLVPIVATALLFQWIYDPNLGLLNYVLSLVGIHGPGWFSSIRWALPSLIILALWGTIGGGYMIIFLAGLQGVPSELYEAAAIDGANSWSKFSNVTLPMISPTMFFNLILGIIGALKVFDSAYVGTHGGPDYATWFYLLHLYYEAFQYFAMGYASALAWIFFVVVISFTVLQVYLSSRWVYYEGEDRR